MEDDGRPHDQSEPHFLAHVGWPEGWSPTPCAQLPSLQHLTQSSPSDQRSCYEHSQASTLEGNDGQRLTHYPRLASIDSAAKGKNIPPTNLPLVGKGTQPYMTNQIPLNSTYSQNEAISPPVSHSHTHQMSQNGAGSPYEEHLPISSWVPGPNAYQSPPCSPEPAFGPRNVKTSDGCVKSLASPTSPLHQPPEGVTSHYIGLFIWIISILKPVTLQGRKYPFHKTYLKLYRLLFFFKGNLNIPFSPGRDGDTTPQVKNKTKPQKKRMFCVK